MKRDSEKFNVLLALNAIFRQPNSLVVHQRGVLAVLALCADESGRAFPGVAYLAQASGLSERTVRRVTATFDSDQWDCRVRVRKVTRRDGSMNRPNEYWLSVGPKAPQRSTRAASLSPPGDHQPRSPAQDCGLSDTDPMSARPPIHTTRSIQQDPPSDPAGRSPTAAAHGERSSEDRRTAEVEAVLEAFAREFRKVRGVDPTIGPYETDAAERLLRSQPVHAAIQVIENAFADDWVRRSGASLQLIARDPNRYLGTARSANESTTEPEDRARPRWLPKGVSI